MKFALFIVTGILAMSCGTKKNAETVVEAPSKNETTPTTMKIVKVTAEIGKINNDYTSDPITIDTIEIRRNIMYIDVTYTGGCEEHDFQVIGSNVTAKSMPAIRSVQLIHKANGDSCKALKKVKLEVYIEDLAEQQVAGSKIYLTVDGWKGKLLYEFQEGGH